MQRIEELVPAQVAPSVKLLRYLNSAAFGWKHRVASIEHALRVLGLVQLRKWAALMAVMTLADVRPAELVRTALVRAHCAERICALCGPEGSCTQAFLRGLLSLLDAMVGRPLEELLGELAVTPAVFSGLLEGAAPLGPILRLVGARERAAWTEAEDGARELGLGEGDLARAYAESLQWADTVLAAGG